MAVSFAQSERKEQFEGNGITQNVIWYVVKSCAARTGIGFLSPSRGRDVAAIRSLP
jgi:hypothetical protein